MRVTRLIPIDQIVMDKWPLNRSTLSLVKHIERVGNLPRPIKVQNLYNGKFKIKNGRHRVTALKLLGYKSIEAKFHVHGKAPVSIDLEVPESASPEAIPYSQESERQGWEDCKTQETCHLGNCFGVGRWSVWCMWR